MAVVRPATPARFLATTACSVPAASTAPANPLADFWAGGGAAGCGLDMSNMPPSSAGCCTSPVAAASIEIGIR